MKSAAWLAAHILPFALGLAAEVPLQLDPDRSRVDVVVHATVDSFVGNLERYEASIRLDATTGEISSADLSFHFSDVKTGKADRDEQMNAWQDTARHPDGVFHLSSLTRGAHGGMTAVGTLTLHDVAREISFPVSVAHDGELYAIDGEATLDTRDFGLPVIKKFLLLKVDPAVKVRFHLQGRAKPGEAHVAL